MFHDHATEEWDQKAGLYLTGRASAKEFVEGVRARVGEGVWRPYLEPHVLRVFFKAKKNGLPDVYHKVKALCSVLLFPPISRFVPGAGLDGFVSHCLVSCRCSRYNRAALGILRPKRHQLGLQCIRCPPFVFFIACFDSSYLVSRAV